MTQTRKVWHLQTKSSNTRLPNRTIAAAATPAAHLEWMKQA